MKKIIIIFITWLIFLNCINKVSSKILTDYTSYELPKEVKLNNRFWIVPWLNFDGRNYLSIIINGYEAKNHKTDLRVFFPLYPFLIKILSFNLLLNPLVIGLLISISAFFGSLFVLTKLLKQDKFKDKEIIKTILLLLLFPTSFYFVSFYTESLFLLLVLLTFYFINKKQFLIASFFCALATSTRVVGLALIPAVFWEAYIYYKKIKKFPFSVLISPFGYLIFSLYIYLSTGSAFSIISKQNNWNRQIVPWGILIALKNGLLKVIYRSNLSKDNIFVYSIEIIEFITVVFIIYALVASFRKIRFSYWLYFLFSSLFIFSTSVLSSLPRFFIVMFPIFIYLANILPNKYYYPIYCLFIILLIYLSSLFLRGYWVA